MQKTYKYRLYPNKTTEKKLYFVLNHCRELYNAALEERKEAYRNPLKGLIERGVRGVRLVTSNDHESIKQTVAVELPAVSRKQAGTPVKGTPGKGARGLGIKAMVDSPSEGRTLAPTV